jgi:hypothetical protein
MRKPDGTWPFQNPKEYFIKKDIEKIGLRMGGE